MSDSILVAIELAHEESYDQALPEAVTIAREKGAHLHLMTVVPNFGMAIISSYLPPDFERESLQKAKEELEEIGRSGVPAGVSWTAHIGHGDVATEILRIAAEVQASVIVMESRPPAAARQFLIGSSAERVVHYSPISVYVLRT